jgi:hypothetical protein
VKLFWRRQKCRAGKEEGLESVEEIEESVEM